MYGPLLEALENGAAVITANKRFARSITRVYNQHRLAAGDVAWSTPAVYSWNAWLHRLWDTARVTEGVDVEGLRLISDTQAVVLWEQIIRESGVFDSEAGRGAGAVAAAWRLVRDWEVLEASEWTDASLSPDQQIFLRWSGEFRERCREMGWVEPAGLTGLLTNLAEQGIFEELQPLVFAGFDNWTPAAIRLREVITARGVAVSLAADTADKSTAVRFECESDRAELESAARWARQRIEANPDASVAVVVRNHDARAAEVRRVFMDVFCPDWRTRHNTDLPVNFSYGEPLINRPRIAAALNILHLTLPSTDYRRFSLVLRTPFLRGGREEANERALLDLRLRDRLGAYFGLGEALPQAKHVAPGFYRLFEGFEDPGRGKRSPREWAGWIAQLLRQLGWPGVETLDSIAWQEIESWNGLLQEYAGTEGLQEPLNWPGALGLLERLARNRIYQPETGPGLIQVMGMLEASGHEFDHLWVTGMNAEDWPESRMPNPLLPASLQRRAKMPGGDPANDLNYAVRVTGRLSNSAGEVVFSWPARRDGESLRNSELIENLELVSVIDQWDARLWAESMVGAAQLDPLTDDKPAAWKPGRKARGGARLFNLQAQCPLRAFLELRLGATEIDRPLIGIGFKERGSLAHDVLEEFYGRYADSGALKFSDEKLKKEFVELVRARLQQLPGMGRRYLRSIAELEVDRLVPLLIEFVHTDAERDVFRVIEREQKHEVTVGPVGLEVRLDRMDELNSGDRIVIDYKTGNVSRTSWNPLRPRDMQLPLYATFIDEDIQAVAFAQVSVNGIGYEGISSEDIEMEGLVDPESMGRGKFKDADGEPLTSWAELTTAWQQTLIALAEDFATGNCRVNPKRAELAEGQFAVLTRLNETVRSDEEDSDG